MARTIKKTEEIIPMLKTIEQMSKISGIGENRLRKLIDAGELEFIQNGNRKLLTEAAVLDWYNRAKTPAQTTGVGMR